MKTNHTQGNWTMEGELDHIHIVTPDIKFIGTGKHICHVYMDAFRPPNYDEAKANAKLIAAAPELLESLIEAVGAIHKCGLHITEPSVRKIIIAANNKAQKTIKKATE